jgi:hypothetical protein
MTKHILFGILLIGIYLELGLSARSPFGEGRCLGFGASPLSFSIQEKNGALPLPIPFSPILVNCFIIFRA